MRPDQEQANAYVLRKSQAGFDRIRQATEKTIQELGRLLGGISGQEAALRPADGGWCIHEVVDHLVSTDRLAVTELRSLISGWRPEDGPIPASLQSADPMGVKWKDLVDELRDVHRDPVAALGEATDDTPDEARAPVAMLAKAADSEGNLEEFEWTENWDWKAYAVIQRVHSLEHIRQIERALAEFMPEAPE